MCALVFFWLGRLICFSVAWRFALPRLLSRSLVFLSASSPAGPKASSYEWESPIERESRLDSGFAARFATRDTTRDLTVRLAVRFAIWRLDSRKREKLAFASSASARRYTRELKERRPRKTISQRKNSYIRWFWGPARPENQNGAKKTEGLPCDARPARFSL